jgi:hypothetical protein
MMIAQEKTEKRIKTRRINLTTIVACEIKLKTFITFSN